MNAYQRGVWRHVEELLAPHAPLGLALDFGSGEGWMTRGLVRSGLVRRVVPVDVQLRRGSRVRPVLYDGARLPFPDRSFDLVLAADVLHHCPDPAACLREALRVSRDLFLLKDHNRSSAGGWLVLALLDEIGNRRFGVPSRYRYQRDWNWMPVVDDAGFDRLRLVHPARCESRPLLAGLVNRFQFLGLWRRRAAGAASAAP